MSRIEYYEQKDILGYRGERILCQKCRDPGESTLWKLLYEVKTKPGARIPKEEEAKIQRIIQQHIMNYHPNDSKNEVEVSILRMKA